MKQDLADYSRKISERQWNLPDKGELESRREETYIDDIIQKNHIERQLLEHLDGIRTVFDGGAGSGRFSILLAFCLCRFTDMPIVWIYFCVQFIDVLKLVIGLIMLRSDFWARNVVSDI